MRFNLENYEFNYVFHQFDYLFDDMDGARFHEGAITGILHGAKKHGITPGADYVYRFIQGLQERARLEKERCRHQKYKRCLAMAWWCKDKIDAIENGYIVSSIHTKDGVITTCPPECNPKFSFYKKWHKRWLELAEKFKEAQNV